MNIQESWSRWKDDQDYFFCEIETTSTDQIGLRVDRISDSTTIFYSVPLSPNWLCFVDKKCSCFYETVVRIFQVLPVNYLKPSFLFLYISRFFWCTFYFGYCKEFFAQFYSTSIFLLFSLPLFQNRLFFAFVGFAIHLCIKAFWSALNGMPYWEIYTEERNYNQLTKLHLVGFIKTFKCCPN